MQTRKYVLMMLAVAGLLAACATTPPVAEQSIDERAQERWNLMVQRDFEGVWEFQTPGYRQTTRQDDYARDMRRRPIRWLEARVASTECEDDRCEVNVAVTYQAIAAPAGQRRMRMTRNIEETWIRLDGQWWHVQN